MSKKTGYNIKIKEFDMSTIPNGSVCLFIGRRNSGKSVMMKETCFFKRKIPCGFVVSPTEDGNEAWKKHVPRRFIHKSFDPCVTDNLIKFQRKQSKQKGKENMAACFAVYDDVMYDTTFPRAPAIRELFMNGRHYKILAMVSTQYCMDLPPGLRSNVDFVFIFKDPIRRNRERLYQHYAGIFPDYDSFAKCMDLATDDYKCMVINNASTSNKISDVVFVYRATPGRKFKMGSKKFWKRTKKRNSTV